MPTTHTRASQDFVPISEIRDGIVVLKNGGLRIVLMVSSINFALKSAEEQTAIILQYQNFLNSLDFHIQLFIQSRKLDIRPYLNTLEAIEKEQTSDLIKIQTREYIGFIKNFTENTNIMAKTFFVVVPYDPPAINPKKGVLANIWPGRKAPLTEKSDDFNEQRTQLDQRAGVVEQGLTRIGLRVITLGTEELVELYFKLFNPGEVDIPTT